MAYHVLVKLLPTSDLPRRQPSSETRRNQRSSRTPASPKYILSPPSPADQILHHVRRTTRISHPPHRPRLRSTQCTSPSSPSCPYLVLIPVPPSSTHLTLFYPHTDHQQHPLPNFLPLRPHRRHLGSLFPLRFRLLSPHARPHLCSHPFRPHVQWETGQVLLQ